MDRFGELSVDASMRYSDIIVPTLDTVRSSFLIELLLTNHKKVCASYTHARTRLHMHTHMLHIHAKFIVMLLTCIRWFRSFCMKSCILIIILLYIRTYVYIALSTLC